MSITTLVAILSAPMPKNSGGLVEEHLTSIRKTQVQSLARTQIFSLFMHYNKHNTYFYN